MTLWGWRSSRTVLIGSALVAFAAFCIAPMVSLVAGAFAASGDVRQWDIPVLLDIRQRSLLYTTTALGLGAAVLSTVVGAPLGLALARVTLPFKPLLRLALVAPSLLPTYVVALAWTYLVAPIAGEWAYSVASAIAVMTVAGRVVGIRAQRPA
jgi:iron(III) transport system permease protein